MAILNDAELLADSIEVLVEENTRREDAVKMCIEPGVMEAVVTSMWQAQETTLKMMAHKRGILRYDVEETDATEK